MRPALRASRPYATRVSRAGGGPIHWQTTPPLCPTCLQQKRRTIQSRAAWDSKKPFQSTHRSFSSAAKLSNKNTPDQTQTSAQDPDPVIIGEEEPLSTESEEDAREYERTLRREEHEEFQRQVDQSLDHRDYRPASDWNGLQWMGGEHDWPKPERGTFRGFVPSGRINDPAKLLYAVNRAAVEVFAAHSAKLPTRRLPDVELEDLMDSEASQVKIAPSSDGQGAVLTFPSEEVRDSLMLSVNKQALDAAEEEEDGAIAEESEIAAADPVAQDPTEAEAEARSDEQEGILEEEGVTDLDSEATLRKGVFGKEWSQVPVTNPIMKLAIARRVTQLTGHVLPDPLMQRATNIGDYADYLCDMVRKPKNLFESLVGKDAAELEDAEGNAFRNFTNVEYNEKKPLADLPNVVISKLRVTPVDREKAVGRWKTIESELKKRGLPVLGKR